MYIQWLQLRDSLKSTLGFTRYFDDITVKVNSWALKSSLHHLFCPKMFLCFSSTVPLPPVEAFAAPLLLAVWNPMELLPRWRPQSPLPPSLCSQTTDCMRDRLFYCETFSSTVPHTLPMGLSWLARVSPPMRRQRVAGFHLFPMECSVMGVGVLCVRVCSTLAVSVSSSPYRRGCFQIYTLEITPSSSLTSSTQWACRGSVAQSFLYHLWNH